MLTGCGARRAGAHLSPASRLGARIPARTGRDAVSGGASRGDHIILSRSARLGLTSRSTNPPHQRPAGISLSLSLYVVWWWLINCSVRGSTATGCCSIYHRIAITTQLRHWSSDCRWIKCIYKTRAMGSIHRAHCGHRRRRLVNWFSTAVVRSNDSGWSTN